MTTVDALKLLYEKLGGDPADVADIQTDAEMIDAVEDVAGLPTTTDANVGDVLTIGADESLEWAAIPTELPDPTGATTGYVLTIGANGPEWAAIPTQQ